MAIHPFRQAQGKRGQSVFRLAARSEAGETLASLTPLRQEPGSPWLNSPDHQGLNQAILMD